MNANNSDTRIERSDLEAKMAEAAQYFSTDSQKYRELFAEFLQFSDAYRKQKLVDFPPNPPNEKCDHAILRGFLTSNESGFSTGDLTPLFKVDNEEVFVWTHTMNRNSALVSKVSRNVHGETVWRNAGSLLRLANGLACDFEHIDDDVDYDWIYNFTPDASVDSLTFYDEHRFDRFRGSVMSITAYANLASIIELLARDETFFVATQNMFASVHNHSCCFVCALAPEGHRPHPNHELGIWQFADAIPHFEAAIVQATRVIEAIMGKPGNRDSAPKLHKAKQRWREAISIDPDSEFKLKSKSHLDYYYELFGIRGDAAHSLGQLPTSLSRELTIE